MRRPVVAALAIVALVAVVAALALAVGSRAGGVQRVAVPGGGPGMMADGPGGEWMQGMVVRDEFDFLAEMVPHHAEAVAAATELRRSERPEMRALGASIVASQSAQIDRMEGWLARWYPDRTSDADYRPMMRDLSDLSDDQLDEAFLSDMVGHHMAAVMMSQQLLVRGLAVHPEVADLARTIREDQLDEIGIMSRWLSDWYGRDRGWMGPGMMW